MKLLTRIGLQILAFDTTITGTAKGSVEPVVVMLAVRCVLENVEFCGREAVATCSANETGPVVASG
jgi:hypothetical protein